MNYGDSGLSASDVALLTNDRNSNNGGFGYGSDCWWILLFLIFGWGRGFGGNYGNGGNDMSYGYNACCAPVTQQGMADAFNFNNLDNAVRGVQNGLCDGFYAMNTSILNGVNGIQSTLCQGFAGVNNAITTNGYETRLGTQALSAQLANCLNRFFIAIKNRLQKVNTVGSIA